MAVRDVVKPRTAHAWPAGRAGHDMRRGAHQQREGAEREGSAPVEGRETAPDARGVRRGAR